MHFISSFYYCSLTDYRFDGKTYTFCRLHMAIRNHRKNSLCSWWSIV